ncbi:MAG TPA: radical SAM protein [Verrucomicrobiota bacterium]|nr:radical SAM protein [Verrucomicrobiota bacterium]
MKILLIAPASGQWRHLGRHWWFNGKTFRFSMLSLLSVAAASPAEAEVRILDEQIEEVPWGERFDLVGITCMTALAPRAYELAELFRQGGTPVVLGGMHPTLCPEEAAGHADAVVVGDAEGLWPEVIADVAAGKSRGIYRHGSSPELAGLARLPRHLLSGRSYATLHAVQATRGCDQGCAFCSVAAAHQCRQRRRPVGEVLEEVGGLAGRFFIFVDDHLLADREYARELLKGLRPLGKRWVTQTTLAITQERELLNLAAEAGCVGVFVGLETFSPANLAEVNKGCHRVEEYRQAVRALHDHGIGVEAGVVFDFDGDRPSVFRQTLDLLESLEIDAVQVSVFTPLPGTKLFSREQGRLLDWNWAHYDFHHVVHQPAGLSVEALQAGHDWGNVITQVSKSAQPVG